MNRPRRPDSRNSSNKSKTGRPNDRRAQEPRRQETKRNDFRSSDRGFERTSDRNSGRSHGRSPDRVPEEREPEQRPRESTPKFTLNLNKGEVVLIGRNGLQEVLRYSPERVLRVFTAKGEIKGRTELLDLLREQKISIKELNHDELTALAGTPSHQSFVAVLQERSFADFSDIVAELNTKPRGLVLLLDEIMDPQNVGTLLRASECFGVDAVVWSKNRGAGLTPSARKASSGASELLTLSQVSNLADAAAKLKEAGFWIVATDGGVDAQDLRGFDFPEKTAIIMGSEGDGVRRLLLDKADFKLKIGMLGKIDSLNVSQAGAVFLNAYRMKFPN